MDIAYLNGSFTPLTEACISPLDRGFLFGDAVYEVIPIYGGYFFKLQEHLQRLEQSLAGIRLTPPLSLAQWEALLTTLVQKNPAHINNVYLQISRGAEPSRSSKIPTTPKPTVFAFCFQSKTMTIDELASGFSAMTTTDTRWKKCYIKSTSLLANCLTRQDAIDQGAHEMFLIENDKVLEGSNSNIFIVKDNTIITPPLTENILGGITRSFVLEIAQQHQITAIEQSFSQSTLMAADEVWISSSTRTIMPIVTVDNTPIGQGTAGPLWRRMVQYYHAALKQYDDACVGP